MVKKDDQIDSSKKVDDKEKDKTDEKKKVEKDEKG